jgi:hypothetical protein
MREWINKCEIITFPVVVSANQALFRITPLLKRNDDGD